MFNKFLVHGASIISIEDNIIMLETTGPWNIEYFYGLHKDLASAVEKVDKDNHAVLIIPYGEAICTYEVIDYHIEFLRQGSAKAVAVNLSKSEVPSATKSICSTAYEAVGVTFDFFNCNEQAKSWLKTKLN